MAEIDSDTFNLLNAQLETCILPELDREIGDQTIGPEDFYTFVRALDMNLRLLFDVLAKDDQLLSKPYDGHHELFRRNFILLLHQQTGPKLPPFGTNYSPVRSQLMHLRDRYYEVIWAHSAVVRKECLAYYKARLTPASWKRNLGAIYGFVNMYELHKQFAKKPLEADELLFMLSVGMLLVDHFEPNFRTDGLTILDLLLRLGDPQDLNRLNIIGVVHKRLAGPLIISSVDATNTSLILNCLVHCIKVGSSWQNPSKWNEIDDIIAEVMQRLALESKCECRMILLMFLARITTLPLWKKTPSHITYKATDFMELNRAAPLDGEAFDQLRDECEKYHNLWIGRWNRKLMEYLKQMDIFGSPDSIRVQVNGLHIGYLIWFYGNPLSLAEHVFQLCDKLTTKMMNLMRLNDGNTEPRKYAQDIKELLKTFTLHTKAVYARSKEDANIDAFHLQMESLQKEMDKIEL